MVQFLKCDGAAGRHSQGENTEHIIGAFMLVYLCLEYEIVVFFITLSKSMLELEFVTEIEDIYSFQNVDAVCIKPISCQHKMKSWKQGCY